MTTDSWRLPRRRDALSFWLRTRLLSLRAELLALWSPAARRWPEGMDLVDAPVVAQHRSRLWSEADDAEFILTAGKVENLRRAVLAFRSVEVPAGGVLSFWAQLGRPSRWRGFVVGREIREGCVVPTVAGGICQLSNALANVAAQAGLTFVERHAHSARVVDGAAGAADATVFWRHVDLKLSAGHAWRLDVAMDEKELVVSLRARLPAQRKVAVTQVVMREERKAARGCLGCDEQQCFRHARHLGLRHQQARTAVLLEAWSPEFSAHLAPLAAERFAPWPVRMAFWRPQARAWGDVDRRERWASLRGALWRRLWARHTGGRRQSAILDAQRWLAQAYAAALTPLHTRLIVDQALLPHLEHCGALAGREVEVLVHALPMTEIHARLDRAAQCWPQENSLRDFRAGAGLVSAEAHGLARARRLVTPHAEAAAVLMRLHGGEIVRLDWAEASPRAALAPHPTQPPLVLLAAPRLARKGALELAAALQGLGCRLRALGEVPAREPLEGVAAVVLPAHVEHAPRLLLRALAAGLPVIATPACGLDARPGLTLVDAGDVQALRAALVAVLELGHG